MKNSADFERMLVNTGYPEFFLFTGSRAEELWNNGENRKKLEAVIENTSSSDIAKLLAAELLVQFDVPLKEDTFPNLAKSYVSALKGTNAMLKNEYQLNGNAWGVLYEWNDAGVLGERVIQFGKYAIPWLIDLLGDNGPILYDGSREATLGNDYQYRIKDFAAFYLSKITNIPIRFYLDHAQRDDEIERFKMELKENGYG